MVCIFSSPTGARTGAREGFQFPAELVVSSSGCVLIVSTVNTWLLWEDAIRVG